MKDDYLVAGFRKRRMIWFDDTCNQSIDWRIPVQSSHDVIPSTQLVQTHLCIQIPYLCTKRIRYLGWIELNWRLNEWRNGRIVHTTMDSFIPPVKQKGTLSTKARATAFKGDWDTCNVAWHSWVVEFHTFADPSLGWFWLNEENNEDESINQSMDKTNERKTMNYSI